MKKIDFGQASQVLANVGVMLGIVFLAIEIGQNQATLEEQNTLTMLSARDFALDKYGEWRILLLENPDLMQVWEKAGNDDSLNDVERLQFDWLCTQNTYLRLSAFNRFVALGQDLEVNEQVDAFVRSIGDSEQRTACWERLKGSIALRGYEPFVDAVDRAREAR